MAQPRQKRLILRRARNRASVGDVLLVPGDHIIAPVTARLPNAAGRVAGLPMPPANADFSAGGRMRVGEEPAYVRVP